MKGFVKISGGLLLLAWLWLAACQPPVTPPPPMQPPAAPDTLSPVR